MVELWDSKDRSEIRNLFEPFKRGRAIIFPALDQGRGTVWVDSLKSPTAALLSLPPFNALTGDSTSPGSLGLIEKIPYMQIVFASDPKWDELVKDAWGDDLRTLQRVRMSTDSLSLDHVRSLLTPLPDGHTLKRITLDDLSGIDPNLIGHIPMFFGTPENFIDSGLGFCIKHGEKVISMCSAFTPFINEFEIEVDTLNKPEYRQKGFATIVSAKLIEYAIENGMVPHWDAANEISVKLALKLGYTNPDRYLAFYRNQEQT